MNNKWLKLGTLTALAAVVGALIISTAAFAQGPAGNPPSGVGVGYGLGGRGGGRGGASRWGGADSSLVSVAAEVLGMDRTELVAALNDGQTIADVAKAEGVALDKIVDAFLAPRADALAQAVAAGRLTQAQADTMLATMKANVTAQLSAPFTPRGNGIGTGFVDADGDGVCDNLGTQQPRGPRGRWNP